jgi:hypothetical protein
MSRWACMYTFLSSTTPTTTYISMNCHSSQFIHICFNVMMHSFIRRYSWLSLTSLTTFVYIRWCCRRYSRHHASHLNSCVVSFVLSSSLMSHRCVVIEPHRWSFLTSFTTFVVHSFCCVLLVLLHATHLNSSVVSSLDHHHRCHIEVLSIASSFISSYMFLHVSSNIFYCFIQWLNWLDATIQLVLLFGMIDDDASLHHLSVVRWCMLFWCFKHSLDERWTWLMIWRMDELF